MITGHPIVGRPPRPRANLWFLIPALLLGAAAATATYDAFADDPIVLPPLPACQSDRAQLTVLVPDVSDSVIASGGSDPTGRSFAEARLLAEHLAATPCTDQDRFGAVIFADRSVEIPPTPLTSLSVIEAGLRRPPAEEIGSGTQIVPAVNAVADMLARHPDHDATIIIISDMGSGEGNQLDQAITNLAPADVHLVALGDHQPDWDPHFDTITQLTGAQRGTIAQALATVVAEHRTGS